jgi:hypothetical protein
MTDGPFQSARSARMLATDFAGTQTVLVMAITDVLNEEVEDGLFTVTYNASSASSGDIQFVTEELLRLGYTVVNTAGSLAISW